MAILMVALATKGVGVWVGTEVRVGGIVGSIDGISDAVGMLEVANGVTEASIVAGTQLVSIMSTLSNSKPTA